MAAATAKFPALATRRGDLCPAGNLLTLTSRCTFVVRYALTGQSSLLACPRHLAVSDEIEGCSKVTMGEIITPNKCNFQILRYMAVGRVR